MNSTALDLCCGAGGLSLGLQRAGFAVHGIDQDEDALDTHRRHVGPCEAGDLRTWHPPRRFAVVAGGPPCQPFSDAGKGLGDEDSRYLIPDFLRVAREAEPRAVFLENVRGLVTRHPRVFRAVLDLFEAEYHTTWTILNAAHYGVPQSRERVFVVGFRDAVDRARFRWPSPSHAPPGEMFGEPHRTVREALSLPPSRPFRTGRIDGASGWQGMRILDIDKPGHAIGTRNNADLLDRPAPCASERLSEALGGLDSVAPTIKVRVDEGRDSDRPSRRPLGELNHAVRLTPEQCALLQGFPAGWTWTGTKGSQHRQIGNAVCPAVGEAVGRAVFAALYG